MSDKSIGCTFLRYRSLSSFVFGQFKRNELDKLACELFRATDDFKEPVVVGPLRVDVHEVLLGPGEEADEYTCVLPIRDVLDQPVRIIEEQPYLRKWTLWERVRFVFTNRLPV